MRDSPTLVDDVVVLFAGDSGDGMQLTGGQFTLATAHARNDLATLPDFPAEIRAPAGTLYGVSGFQLHFGSGAIHTPGDEVDLLVAMNPAALKVNLHASRRARPARAGAILVNTSAFTESDLDLAGYDTNPLEDGSLDGYEVHPDRADQAHAPGARRDAACRARRPTSAQEHLRPRPGAVALHAPRRAGASTGSGPSSPANPSCATPTCSRSRRASTSARPTETFAAPYEVAPARLQPGRYRAIRERGAGARARRGASPGGPEAASTAPTPSRPRPRTCCTRSRNTRATACGPSRPRTRSRPIGAAIGASFGGGLGVTATSGPGLALKSEFIGLATMTELPLVIVDVQRAGPSTGMPTKTSSRTC